jgi:hypothetical protein
MKFALQIYGQLRTFDKCLPSFLNFIDYYENDYDVFLFIDSTDDMTKYEYLPSGDKCQTNFSESSLNILKNILIEDRIKCIHYTNDMSENEKSYELKQKNDMIELWEKYNKKYGNITLSYFATSLAYRKYLLNTIRMKYEDTNKIVYDYVIDGRFDFGTTYKEKYPINESTTPILFSDCISIGKPEFINKMSEYGIYYPITPKYIFDKNCDLIHEKYEKYKNWRGDKFWEKNWIFMPEMNQRLFLLENNISFIEAWWKVPCNYGFKIIR